MATGDPVGFRAGPALQDAIEDYGDRRGLDKSDALRELVEVGLREQRHPWLWRFKDRVIEWVNLLSISAVLVLALGLTTRLVTWIDGVIAAFFMLALATCLLGGFEVARVLSGSNERGVWLRAVVASVVSGRE